MELLRSIPPALQELDLFLHHLEDQCVEICAPALKSLTIRINCRPLWYQSKIGIDSPKLEYLKTRGELVWYHFVNHQTQLRTASITGWIYWMSKVEQQKKLGCLASCISSVTKLRLHTYALLPVLNAPTYSEDGVDLIGVVFRNLIHLSIKTNYNVNVNWSDEIPTWVLSKLKKVDVTVIIKNGDCNAIDLLMYILSNSDVLEQLVVISAKPWRHDDNEDKLDEEAFCRVLFGFSRISSTCEIQFHGINNIALQRSLVRSNKIRWIEDR